MRVTCHVSYHTQVILSADALSFQVLKAMLNSPTEPRQLPDVDAIVRQSQAFVHEQCMHDCRI